MSIIEVSHLKYRYPDTTKLVLDDISFSVEEGEFIGLIGRNTAGKSTLCYALTGLIPHFFKGGYGGTVTVAGLNVRNTDVSEVTAMAGLVFENPFSQITGSRLTVYEEIAFGLENMGLAARRNDPPHRGEPRSAGYPQSEGQEPLRLIRRPDAAGGNRRRGGDEAEGIGLG